MQVGLDMSKMGNFKCKGLKEFQKKMEQLQDPDVFAQACARELAARLLRMVIKRTPVGDYNTYWTDKDGTRLVDSNNKEIVLKQSARKGGTLRRGWTANKNASAKDYADSLKVNHFGDTYVIEIINTTEYASYVEFGHRTPNHKGWVKGQFMMTISEQELQTIAPKILEKRIQNYLEGCLK